MATNYQDDRRGNLSCFNSSRRPDVKQYKLIGTDGQAYLSHEPGILGGYRRGSTRIYGRLDCANALRWIAKGHYVAYRVFFKDEATAIAAGFRACRKCKP